MWYVVQSKQRGEFRALENLNRQGFDCYLPLIRKEKILNGRLVKIQVPLYSRYLFVRQTSTNQNFSIIRSTFGVTSLVSFGAKACLIGDQVIQCIRNLEKIIPDVELFKEGDLVQLTAGPLKGLSGTLKCKNSSHRADILIEFLSKNQLIEVELKDLKAIEYV